MSLQLHQPDGHGGLRTSTGEKTDFRRQLTSPRWGSGLKNKQLPALANPEMNPTSTVRSAMFWLALAGLTFVLLVAFGIAR